MTTPRAVNPRHPAQDASGNVTWLVCGPLYGIEQITQMLCTGLCLVTWTIRAAWHNS
jgi:hypothetical protein